MTDIRIRDYEASDADKLNRTAIAAFGQFRDHYQDWPAMLAGLSKTSDLSASGEVIIAEFQHAFAGAVVYFGPDRPKAPFFDQSWPIIRMLVVDPAARGKSIGRQLTEECLRRAERDQACVIALHTTPIMTVALAMYLRMGFARVREAPDILGVPYAVYVKTLG